jgi:hypothetical protein
MITVRELENRNRNTVFSNKVERKSWNSAVILITAVFKLYYINFYIKLLEIGFIFHNEGRVTLETSNFSLIFLADSLEILSNHFGSIWYDFFILFAQLIDQRYIKCAGLVFIINFCVRIVGGLDGVEVLFPKS